MKRMRCKHKGDLRANAGKRSLSGTTKDVPASSSNHDEMPSGPVALFIFKVT